VHKLNGGKNGFKCQSCRYEAETYWYKKSIKYRNERNFWLSLFNFFLWFLVWRIHQLKGKVIQLKERIRVLEVDDDSSKKEKIDANELKPDGLKKNE